MSEIRVTSVVGENGGDRVGLTTGLTVGPLTGTTVLVQQSLIMVTHNSLVYAPQHLFLVMVEV